jgi:hypothetical protein
MEPNVAEILRNTAKNISELFEMVANRIDVLEKENAELKLKVGTENDSK